MVCLSQKRCAWNIGKDILCLCEISQVFIIASWLKSLNFEPEETIQQARHLPSKQVTQVFSPVTHMIPRVRSKLSATPGEDQFKCLKLFFFFSFTAQWHQQPQSTKPKKVRPSASRYAALSDQGLDIKAAFQPDANASHLTLNSGLVESEDL